MIQIKLTDMYSRDIKIQFDKIILKLVVIA